MKKYPTGKPTDHHQPGSIKSVGVGCVIGTVGSKGAPDKFTERDTNQRQIIISRRNTWRMPLMQTSSSNSKFDEITIFF